ncbi:GNAT family N-acetyltransferase [Humitalea sp. 24SJ18S-53]|uniref:GNAT family N-acetyltransferase n=1 Tax=Humitalea sp. 24SJ18S-53 TaxID=3422307 RepID=UPI003D6687C7
MSARVHQIEEVREVTVDVTFLRMDQAPATAGEALPAGCRVTRVRDCSVPFYRFLYDTVGAAHLWWMRRVAPDGELAAAIGHPAISIHVLYRGGQPVGFYELERRSGRSINIAYFGLLPVAIGQGLGRAFLDHAVASAWAEGCRFLTVNTCTADHPRALPGYFAAGFERIRTVSEVWPIPVRLGMKIPAGL